jgi:hypothetical protein
MPRSARKLAPVLAMICCCTASGASIAQPSTNRAGFVSSGQTATLNCAGGAAEIMGSNNVLTITGKCSKLDLAGSNNKITIEFASGATISFVGSSNAITWSSADAKPPKVSYVGSDNTLTPPIQ